MFLNIFGPVSPTNGSERPKNIWIRNTVKIYKKFIKWATNTEGMTSTLLLDRKKTKKEIYLHSITGQIPFYENTQDKLRERLASHPSRCFLRPCSSEISSSPNFRPKILIIKNCNLSEKCVFLKYFTFLSFKAGNYNISNRR